MKKKTEAQDDRAEYMRRELAIYLPDSLANDRTSSDALAQTERDQEQGFNHEAEAEYHHS